MPLDAVVRTHDEHRVVEGLQRALRLGGEIDMAGRIEHHEMHARPVEMRLLGKDRDTALALHGIGIEMRVALVHAPLPTDGARAVEHGFRQRGLARVDVGDETDDGMGHGDSASLGKP